jgi:Chaperone of endosialidase
LALTSNTTGHGNTANGATALLSNTTGNNNTANGFSALGNNTTGNNNSATGFGALVNNVANDNTANGYNTLSSNTIGSANTAEGRDALLNNTMGTSNTAIGLSALLSNTEGGGNTAVGSGAGDSQTTGSNNVYIGLGVPGVAGESNACYIASIFGQTSPNGVAVFINSNNKLGTATSSERFKDNIKPMDKASEALFALKPVTFRYKKDIDPLGIPQLGLVAEDVEKVNPDLVVRDKEKRPYSVRYDQVNAMLLNEFLKEHRKAQQLEANAARHQKQIEALTAGLQKVSAQLELSKSAPQTVLNND